MKTAYPIILTPDEQGYIVSVPDLGIHTQGTDIADAINMAADAISIWGITTEDLGKPIPPASKELPACGPEEMSCFAVVDFEAYRRTYNLKTVRKNVTLPGYLNELAEKAGINFSQVLQEGLRQKLGLS